MAKTARKSEERYRQCAATRVRRPVEQLIRFVRAPDETVVPDLKAELEGRGVWVTCSAAIVSVAIEKNLFAARFRAPVKADPELADRLDSLLSKSALQILGLANKAGQVITGFQKVDAALESRRIMGVFHGSDGSQDGVQKLDRKFSAIAGDAARTFVCFTVEELSLALGRSNVVHAALMFGGASLSVLKAVERLTRYRTGNLADIAA